MYKVCQAPACLAAAGDTNNTHTCTHAHHLKHQSGVCLTVLLLLLLLLLLLQDEDDDGEGVEEQRPWHKRPKVWLHAVAFGLSACLLLVGIGSQFVPWMNVVSGGGGEADILGVCVHACRVW
jgi:hypothetical protein